MLLKGFVIILDARSSKNVACFILSNKKRRQYSNEYCLLFFTLTASFHEMEKKAAALRIVVSDAIDIEFPPSLVFAKLSRRHKHRRKSSYI